jgi:hypothetical protein
MLSKMNKAWVAGVVGFIAMQVGYWAGWEIDQTVQNAIIGAIMFGLTWLVPNKT